MYTKRIKELRDVLGLSVPKLAERINIKARTIVSYETGRVPSLEFAAQLFNVYKVNLNWFVSGKGDMFIKEQPADFKSTVKQAIQELIREGELNKDDFI